MSPSGGDNIPIISFVRLGVVGPILLTIALPATILVAWLSYRYVERPVMRWHPGTVWTARPARSHHPPCRVPSPKLGASPFQG